MAHTLRSHTGCHRCKQRRVKCDEKKPTCGACSRNRFDCVWPSLGSQKSTLWSSRTMSMDVYTRMLLQQRYGRMDLALTRESETNCPAYSISPGYAPLRNAEEHRLFASLAPFLRLQAAFTSHQIHLPKAGFEFTVALQEPWVRSSLLSLAALIVAARGLGPLTMAFEYYGAAIQSISQRLSSTSLGKRENEELLVAALFLGLMDTNIASNQIHPSYYFITVGRILKKLGMTDDDLMGRDLEKLSPAHWFRRIAYESYLHQMSGGAFRHPQSYKSVRLIHPSTYPVGGLPSSVDTNALVPIDFNCFYILYEISRLHHSSPVPSLNTVVELQNLQKALQDLGNRYQEDLTTSSPETTTNEQRLYFQFTILTRTALGVLQIFAAKALNPSLTPSSPEIQQAREFSLAHLRMWIVSSSLWPGYLSWIFAVLLCAAETEHDVRVVYAKIDDFLSNVFGANLDHLKGVVEKLSDMKGVPAHREEGGLGMEAAMRRQRRQQQQQERQRQEQPESSAAAAAAATATVAKNKIGSDGGDRDDSGSSTVGDPLALMFMI